MENRPRGREKNIQGGPQSVNKHGSGLGTGPVGSQGGYSGRGQATGGGSGRGQAAGGAPGGGHNRAAGTRTGRSGMLKIVIIVLVLLLGGGGGLTALLGGGSDAPAQQPGQNVQQPAQQPSGSAQGAGLDLSSLFGSLGGGSVSTGWQSEANTGKLDKSVASGARAKYVTPFGNGRDTVTLMVYMCGTDLESRSGMGTADLQEMLAADFGNNVNLLVYTGGCKGWKNNQVSSSTNQIWQVKGGKLVSLESDLGAVPMTNPDTLSGYISWCAKKYPASRYGLIFWDHGGGSVSGYGYDEKFASSGSMNLAGIDTALGDGGVKFDFIGFDACLMATAETALTLTKYADYLIASEETEPGVGWYYTDWLTELGKNTSMPTIELGQMIVDSFVDTCAEKCRGQLTTLSVIDLAELEATLPKALAEFSRSASKLIADKDYQTVSNARAGTREFASSSKIDQVDLVHLARNLGTDEGEALAKALLGAVKYNRTSSNMTNAYGISIYFPYQKTSGVDKAVSTYKQIGMDEEYMRCIRQFASLEASGQAVSGGTASPLPSLMGSLASAGGGDLLGQVLEGFLSGGFGRVSGLDEGNSDFLSDRALSDDELAEYLEGRLFDASALVWSEGADGVPVMALPEEQWKLVQTLELNVFYDDGEGYLDLGLDNVFDFDDTGALLGTYDGTWLAINGQPVAYYHTCTVDDGESYTITGRVPVLWNGERAELLLSFDNERPYGYVAGVRSVYADGETDTVAKSVDALEAGDVLEFICDYYGYDGEYLDSYLIGEPLTVTEAELEISNVPLDGSVSAVYRFTDLFNQQYWSLPMAAK